jgi:phosphocarrier protein
MLSRQATVTAAVGLHARPAAVFVRAVVHTGLPVTVAHPGQDPVDARSLLEVMTADFCCGAVVELRVAAPVTDEAAAERALERLAELLATDLSDPARDS